MTRLLFWFSLIGLAIPSVWMFLYHYSSDFSKWWYEAPSWAESALLVVWPSSILLVADPMDDNVGLWMMSAALNAGLYALVGGIIVAVFSRKRSGSRVGGNDSPEGRD